MSAAEERWKALFDQRHAWATRAYDDFMDSLSPEVRERMGHKSAEDEAYVVVFGKTQVGKTTLILDLVGVVPEAMERVSTVLRGGRDPGQSATSTAMEYRRSSDGRWGLQVEDVTSWFESDGEMTYALGQLRASMEARALNVTQPCVVCLPETCFGTGPDQTLIRILDLPGDKPADQAEQEHVHAMARQYIPLADLILLVGRSDDLTFLQPGRLSLPGIENWQSIPNRFRIVTTFSFEPKDVRDALRKRTATDIQEIRESLIQEIEKAGPLSPRARRPEWFFPLEFGDSWRAVMVSNKELYERISPLIDELKRCLRRDIHESTGSWARLKNAVSAHVVVAELMEERLEELNRGVAECQGKKGDHEQYLKEVEKSLKIANDKLLKINNEIPISSFIAKEIKRRIKWPKTTEIIPTENNVSDFRARIELARLELARAPSESYISLENIPPLDTDSGTSERFWSKVKLSSLDDHNAEINRIVDDAFLPLTTRLTAYFWDKYWLTSSPTSDYQIDMRLFDTGLKDARQRVQQAVSSWWLSAAMAQRKRMKVAAENVRCRELELKQLSERLRHCLEESGQDLERAEARRADQKHRMEKDLAESRRFVRMLDEYYLEELLERRREIIGGNEPTARLLALMATVQLAVARTKLLHCVGDELQPSATDSFTPILAT